MSWAAIHKQIEEEFTSQWAGATPIAYGDTPFRRPQHGPFVRITVLFMESENAALGQVVRDNGYAVIQVFTPKKEGERNNLTLADQAKAVFQNKTFGKLTFYAASVNQVGETEGFLQSNVSIPFYYQ
ncbi:MAG: phage tail terminator-like protein [Synergistaceae bacterium]